jgi:hypothetical protein
LQAQVFRLGRGAHRVRGYDPNEKSALTEEEQNYVLRRIP